jgi:hypothetical protein
MHLTEAFCDRKIVISSKVGVVSQLKILKILEGVRTATQPQAKIGQVLETLQFLNQGVNFDKLFQGSTWSSEPAVKTIIVGEVAEHMMVLSLQEFVDNPRMQRSTQMPVKIRI